jgi:serine/threonine protein kinase
MVPSDGEAGPLTPGRQFTPPAPGEAIVCEGRYYWLGRYIGQGYFGAVFECTDEWSNPLVAKVLLPQNRTYEEAQVDWLRELLNLQSLRHPYITFVHAAFEYRDTFYLILERCDSTLAQLMAWPDLKGSVWVHPVAQCMLQAIDYIHSVGYVHKDIHPGNVHIARSRGVMGALTPTTVFKIGDLGLTRLEPEIDVLNTMLAKWMLPPEALRPDEFGLIGRKVDIYHAGLTLLSLLLGSIPTFTEDEIIEGAPRKLAESLSSPYGPVIASALRRHVGDRTESALQMWREIAVATYSLPGGASNVSGSEQGNV